MGRDSVRRRWAAMLILAAMAVLFVSSAAPAHAQGAPSLTVSDAEGNPVADINIVNAAPGDGTDRTWFISLADGAPPTEVSYLFTNFINVEVGCNEPELEVDQTCDEESSQQTAQAPTVRAAAAAAAGLPGELDDNLLMTVLAGTVDDNATTCSGPGVTTVGQDVKPSSMMDNPAQLGDGLLLAGGRLCVAVALNLPFSATNMVQSDQLAFAFQLQTVPAALPPTDNPPNEPSEPTANPPQPNPPAAPTPPRPEPPIGRSGPVPRPPLAATGLGIATLLVAGAAMLGTGAVVVQRTRRRRQES